jgi:hypothetical protein
VGFDGEHALCLNAADDRHMVHVKADQFDNVCEGYGHDDGRH